MEEHLGEEIQIEELAETHEQMIISLGEAMRYTRFWLKKHDLIADGFFPEIYNKSTHHLC
ncbi:hypothetical protein BET01_08640 [Lacrimispora algidixylanolytica]|uniref:Uncharacterized protein n=1 Tax=Lacrimispora algidixylanolytica TaxID=94868 RepID=A0A419SW05_9FIRM|nr:hypothetical protein BET01_08640 [Lacrimispora algidixylanolytica]